MAKMPILKRIEGAELKQAPSSTEKMGGFAGAGRFK